MAGDVLLLDDDDDLRAVLAAMITRESGRSCVSLRAFDELVKNRRAALQCELAILDVNLGSGPSGLDAFAWLRAERFAGRIIFFSGHASNHPLVERAAQLGQVEILTKPIDLDRVIALLRGRGAP